MDKFSFLKSIFGNGKYTKDGLNYACKECIKKYSKKYYCENYKKLLENNRIWHQNNKEKVFLRACHYTNLQPLWAQENFSKGSKNGK